MVRTSSRFGLSYTNLTTVFTRFLYKSSTRITRRPPSAASGTSLVASNSDRKSACFFSWLYRRSPYFFH
ncbi:hypothetical protein L6452_33616 [Arctium lappa]|uniref:Uncharacterized protein n=1 Tax=Arctium lappa TaxID=4217 RepID=A0ACB8YGV3_ARCLA|nr:hypothetical protein L6452_33616 [Arctium lappa]